MNEDLRAVFLLNKTEEKRMLTRELKRALEELGFPLAQNPDSRPANATSKRWRSARPFCR